MFKQFSHDVSNLPYATGTRRAPGPAHAAEARQSARIPDVSPVPSSLAPRPPVSRNQVSHQRGAEPAARPPVEPLVRLGRSRVRDDINAPARQLGCESGVLAFLPDRQ